MLKKKTAPSFEDRLGSALAEAAAAESIVTNIADDLELAARSKREIATDITFEIDRLGELIDHLTVLRQQSEEEARLSETKANKFRALVSA